MNLDALIQQLRLGDPNAGVILVSAVAPRLLGYAAILAPELGPADHEEIVERAIEKAVLKIDRFDPAKGTFPAWTRAFVRYEVLTWRRNHPEGTDLPLNAAESLPAPEEDEETVNEVSDRETAMASQVLLLPEASQLLLRLRYAEQLDFPAIAEQLGITHATARKRHQRILEELRRRSAADSDLKHLGGDR